MQPGVSNRILLGIFAALAMSSVGLKAAAGPPRNGTVDPHRGAVEQQIITRLQGQGFATWVQKLHVQSSIIHASRGACRLSARDARNGDGTSTVYAQQAAAIGPLRYLYRGRAQASPPVLAIRIGRFETELINRAGFQAPVHVPVALAASQGCGNSDFGLGDVRIAA